MKHAQIFVKYTKQYCKLMGWMHLSGKNNQLYGFHIFTKKTRNTCFNIAQKGHKGQHPPGGNKMAFRKNPT